MDLTDVIELMSIVDSMDNISEVTVTFGDSPSVSIKKENKTAPAFVTRAGIPSRFATATLSTTTRHRPGKSSLHWT